MRTNTITKNWNNWQAFCLKRKAKSKWLLSPAEKMQQVLYWTRASLWSNTKSEYNSLGQKSKPTQINKNYPNKSKSKQIKEKDRKKRHEHKSSLSHTHTHTHTQNAVKNVNNLEWSPLKNASMLYVLSVKNKSGCRIHIRIQITTKSLSFLPYPILKPHTIFFIQIWSVGFE